MSDKDREDNSIENHTNASLEEFKFIVENSNDIVSVTDENLNTVYLNARGRKFLGYSSDEYIKKAIIEYLHPHDAEKATNPFKRL